jgi:hypothetical protein
MFDRARFWRTVATYTWLTDRASAQAAEYTEPDSGMALSLVRTARSSRRTALPTTSVNLWALTRQRQSIFRWWRIGPGWASGRSCFKAAGSEEAQ